MRVLAGDIGGTKTILCILEQRSGRLEVVREQVFSSNNYRAFEALLQEFLKDEADPAESACFGVAGPVVGNSVQATNLPWGVDGARVAARTSIPRVKVINDFAAQAYGVFEVRPQETVALNPKAAAPDPEGPVAVLGAGTGLGEAFVLRVNGRAHVVSTEGGHVDFAPRTDREIGLLNHLRRKFGRVSYERVLAGSGLVNIYEFLRDSGAHSESERLREARESAADAAPLISRAALEGGDPLASEALDLFVSIYGAEAGNLALKVIARGGVFVTGGIAAKILPRLQAGGFMAAFTDKGRLSPIIATFPVTVVLNPRAGLLGAAAEAARIAGTAGT